MKVAIFTDTFTPQVNGVARTFQRFVEHLEQQSIDYQLFVPQSREEELFSNKIHRFVSLPFLLYPECRLAFPNVYSIRKQLEAFEPDLIHIATPFNMGLIGLYYGKKQNIPTVASYHTHFDQYLNYYELSFLSKPIWRYMRWFHQSVSQTFVPSESTRAELIQRGFSDLSIWSRGVDCDVFHPNVDEFDLRKEYKIAEPHILTYVGRLAPEKDLDILMSTAEALPDSINNQIHWLIVGDGPMYDKLGKQSPHNMTFTGYQEGGRLAQIYASSTLFFFPSSTETFGNVVLESLSSGTPAIGARSGGVQEIIQDQITGLLCEPRNTDQFTKAVVRVIENDELRMKMSRNARTYAVSRSWNAVFSQLLYDYEKVLSDQRHTNYA